jgi:S1-C subfamily serine protease
MPIDIVIAILLIMVIFRGREIGGVRQICSVVGFVTGLFLGAMLQPHVVGLASTGLGRSLISITVTLGSAMLLLSAAEFGGVLLKQRLQRVPSRRLDSIDGLLGSLVAAASCIVGIWLLYPVISGLPDPGLQQALRKSNVISTLNQTLPPAPKVLSNIGHIISPNGFPDVFAGVERAPVKSDAPLPSLGDMQAAVSKTRASVVKLEGQGCGGLVEGSGYIASKDTVVTNAHVVAGVSKPTVIDQAGRHATTVVWFDPDLDVAILRVTGLSGTPLTTLTGKSENGTPAVVVGYPGGGNFAAKPASISDQFTATGHNIYGQGDTNRSIYELKADIIPGNSGGPLLNKDGAVIGLIFAQSTAYDQVGYALTMQPVVGDLNQALAQNKEVGTGRCAQE